MTTTAHEDQFTADPEHVTHRPYDAASILRQNVADLERELQRQRERHAAATARLRDQIERVTSEWERAEAELKAAREQEPVAWCDPVEFRDDPWSFQGFRRRTKNYPTMPLYATPIPAPAPAVPDDDSLVNLVYKHFYTEKDQSCLLHDVGPYELTEPRPALRDFARALLQSAEAREDLQSFIDSRDAWMARAMAAEAELKAAREQEPALFVSFCDDDTIRFWSTDRPKKSRFPIREFYNRPIPAPAVPDANPVQWLEDEGDMILVPRGLLGAACSSIDKQRPAPKVLEALRYYTMNAPQSPAVPELDPMNRLIVLDPKQPKLPQQATSVPKEWRDYVFAAADELRLTVRDLKNGFVRCGNCGEQETTSDLDCVSDIDGALELLDELLQSAPATVAVTAEWREVISDLLANDGADGGRYDASKWLAARDKARALLQSAPAVPAPAVPYGVDQEAANRISLAVYDWEKGINPEPLLYAINRILATEAHPLSEDGLRAMLQSASASTPAQNAEDSEDLQK